MIISDFKYPYYGYFCVEGDVIYMSVVGVHESLRGKGLFRKLIQDTKETYRVIKVPQPSPIISKILLGYGFVHTWERHQANDVNVDVMVWVKGE